MPSIVARVPVVVKTFHVIDRDIPAPAVFQRTYGTHRLRTQRSYCVYDCTCRCHNSATYVLYTVSLLAVPIYSTMLFNND